MTPITPAPVHHCILVDFENTQTIDIQKLDSTSAKLVIFMGQNQKNLPVDLVKRLLETPALIEIIESAGTGKNALDFQMAFYAGRIFTQNPACGIYIISGDKGFDPLVKHIQEQGRACSRVADIIGLPFIKTTPVKPFIEKQDFTEYSLSKRIELAVTRLRNMEPNSRPRRLKTLKSSLSAMFDHQLEIHHIGQIVNEFIESKVISLGDKETISYNL